MVVGMGEDPSLGEYERLLLSMKTTARKELVLLHPDRSVPPGSTRRWLKVRFGNAPFLHARAQTASEPTVDSPASTRGASGESANASRCCQLTALRVGYHRVGVEAHADAPRPRSCNCAEESQGQSSERYSALSKGASRPASTTRPSYKRLRSSRSTNMWQIDRRRAWWRRSEGDFPSRKSPEHSLFHTCYSCTYNREFCGH